MRKLIKITTTIFTLLLVSVAVLVTTQEPNKIDLNELLDKVEIIYSEGDNQDSVTNKIYLPELLEELPDFKIVWRQDETDFLKLGIGYADIFRPQDKDEVVQIYAILHSDIMNSGEKAFKLNIKKADDVIINPELEAKKEELQDLINKLIPTEEDKVKYTEESIKNLEEKLSNAQDELDNNLNITVEDIDNLINDLNNAKDQLEVRPEIILEELRLELIAKIKQKELMLDEAKYTKKSIDEAKVIINAAKQHVESNNKHILVAAIESLDEVDETLVTLEEQELIDKKEDLENIIEELRPTEKDKEDFTEESIKDLEEAIKDAENKLEGEDLTVEDIEEIIKDLEEKHENLVPKTDKELEAKKEELQDLINDLRPTEEDIDIYTEESIKNLVDKLDEAQNQLDSNNDLTIEEIDKIIKDLNEAHKNLVSKDEELVEIQKGLLDKAIKHAQERLLKEIYVPSTVTSATKAINEGLELLDRDFVSLKELKTAIENLKAIEYVIQANYDELETEINNLKLEIEKTDLYTKESIDNAKVLLEEALKVFNNKEISIDNQKIIDNQVKAIKEFKFVTKAEQELIDKKEELENKIEELRPTEEDKEINTEESINDLEEAIKDAENKLENEDLTVEDIEEIIKDLEEKHEALETKEDKEIRDLQQALKDKIAEKELLLDGSIYTAESIAKAEEIIDAAKTKVDSKVKEELQNAIDSLDQVNKVLVTIDDQKLIDAKNKLSELIDELEEKLTEATYTPSTIKEVNEAISNAKSVLENEESNLADIQDEINKLNGLEFIIQANYDELETEINNLKLEIEKTDLYTKESIDNAKVLLEEALKVFNNKEISIDNQKIIDNQVKAIKEYVFITKSKDEKINALGNLIDRLRELECTDYTKNSYNELTSELVLAESLFEQGTKADEEDLEYMINRIKELENKLVYIKDLRDLTNKVVDLTNTTIKTKNTYKEKLVIAKNIVVKANASKTEVENAIQELQEAIDNLVYYTELLERVSVFEESMKDITLIESNKKEADELIKKVKDSIDKEDLTIEEINALIEEINTFNFIESANYDELEVEINKLKSEIAKTDLYTEESINNAKSLLEKALKVFNNKEISIDNQKIIDNQVKEIKEFKFVTIEEQELIINKDELKGLIDEATEMLKNPNDYVKHSYDILKTHTEFAIDVYENSNDLEEVQSEINSLRTVIDEVIIIKELRLAVEKLQLEINNNEDKYYTESVNEARKIINESNELMKDATLQSVIDDQLEKVLNFRLLTKDEGVNFEELLSLINDFKTLEKNDYTKNSYSNLEKYIIKGEKLVDLVNTPTNKEIDNIISLIKEAFEDLVELNDLKDAIDKFEKSINEKDLTESNLNDAKALLNRANNLLAKEDASLVQITNKIKLLNNFDFILRANIESLLEEINLLEDKLINKDLYTTESYNKAKEILNRAIDLSNNKDLSKDDQILVDQMVEELRKVILVTKEEAADLKLLKEKIAEVSLYNQNDYTAESFDNLINEKDLAQELINSTINPNNELVKGYIKSLTNLMNDLVSIKELKDLISKREKEMNYSLYTAESINELKDLIKEAKLAMVSAEQYTINAHIEYITQFTFYTLELKEVIDQLILEVEYFDKLVLGDINEDIYRKLQIEIEKAEKIIDQYRPNLQEAKDLLNKIIGLRKQLLNYKELRAQIINYEENIFKKIWHYSERDYKIAKDYSKQAEELLKDDNATQEKIDELVNKMKKHYENSPIVYKEVYNDSELINTIEDKVIERISLYVPYGESSKTFTIEQNSIKYTKDSLTIIVPNKAVLSIPKRVQFNVTAGTILNIKIVVEDGGTFKESEKNNIITNGVVEVKYK